MGSLVAVDSKEEAGATKERSSERRRQWHVMAQATAAASERERETESGRAQIGEEGEAGAAGAPGRRPGRVLVGAWAPGSGRVLSARHGGTARPAVARAGADTGREEGALAG